MSKLSIGNRWPYFAIACAVLLLFVLLFSLPAVRVGDGSEYYAMFLAWGTEHRPWMNATSFAAYDALVGSRTIAEMVPTATLAEMFSALKVGNTADFNHFWFYSLAASVCGKFVSLLGIPMSPHRSFLVLHCALLCLTATIAFRHYRWRGVLAVALMIFASPVFWFIDKVHTEFMTVCLILSAVMLFRAQRYIASAALIALAATQNPSFALVACIPLFYRVVVHRDRPYRLLDVILAVVVVLAVLAHPVYYFSRYGVVTPQLLAGGAALGRNIGSFYIWIFDPDLGLLPNWPLGLLVLLAGAATWLHPAWRSRVRSSSGTNAWPVFVLAYLAINFFAHASTVNLNSGATPGLARYALWYLPLFFPVFMWVIDQFPLRSKKFYVAAPVVLLLTLVSLNVNDPRRSEHFNSPSLSSYAIQSRLPLLYNPPVEVFLERYSGIGEAVYARNPRVILGPDCKKALLLPGADRHGGIASQRCLVDAAYFDAYADSAPVAALIASGGTEPHYANLPAAALQTLRIALARGPHGTGNGSETKAFLGNGWSAPEPWGVWSDRKSAVLVLPCDESQYFGRDKPFNLSLSLRPFGQQTVTIRGSAGTLWEGPIAGGGQVVTFAVPAANCQDGRYTIKLTIPGAISPRQKGMSDDPRELGVGLSQFEVNVP